jgi:hypothetical protein
VRARVERGVCEQGTGCERGVCVVWEYNSVEDNLVEDYSSLGLAESLPGFPSCLFLLPAK